MTLQSETASSQNSTYQAAPLTGLYQEILVEHSKKPRFKVSGRPTSCQYCQEGKNPLCGDEVHLYFKFSPESKMGLVKFSVEFSGSGCSISQASTSMLCEKMQGVTFEEAKSISLFAEGIYSGKNQLLESEDDIEDDLESLRGVAKFPVRVKCAALPWKTLELALSELFSEKGDLKQNLSAMCSATVCTNANKQTLKVISE